MSVIGTGELTIPILQHKRLVKPLMDIGTPHLRGVIPVLLVICNIQIGLDLTCLDCPGTGQCGGGNGYCTGDTGNPQVPCVENPTTKQYSPVCAAGINCGGQCSGSCGSAAVFGWSCQYDSSTNTHSCKFDKSKWWVMFLWVLFFLIVLALLIAAAYYLLKPKPQTPAPIIEVPRTPPTTVIVQQPSIEKIPTVTIPVTTVGGFPITGPPSTVVAPLTTTAIGAPHITGLSSAFYA